MAQYGYLKSKPKLLKLSTARSRPWSLTMPGSLRGGLFRSHDGEQIEVSEVDLNFIDNIKLYDITCSLVSFTVFIYH